MTTCHKKPSFGIFLEADLASSLAQVLYGQIWSNLDLCLAKFGLHDSIFISGRGEGSGALEP